MTFFLNDFNGDGADVFQKCPFLGITDFQSENDFFSSGILRFTSITFFSNDFDGDGPDVFQKCSFFGITDFQAENYFFLPGFSAT